MQDLNCVTDSFTNKIIIWEKCFLTFETHKKSYNESYQVLTIAQMLSYMITFQVWFCIGKFIYCTNTHTHTYIFATVFSYIKCMMTSSNGNIFRVTGPLCGIFSGPGEFPTQRPVTWSFDVFFDLRLNKRLSKQPWGWWFEMPSWSLWHYCNELSKLMMYGYPPDSFMHESRVRSCLDLFQCSYPVCIYRFWYLDTARYVIYRIIYGLPWILLFFGHKWGENLMTANAHCSFRHCPQGRPILTQWYDIKPAQSIVIVMLSLSIDPAHANWYKIDIY